MTVMAGTLGGRAHARQCDIELVVLRPGRHAVLAGRLDVEGVATIREPMYRLVDDGDGERDIVLDVSEAVVVDTCGLGLLVAMHQRARLCGRRLVLLDAPPRLESLIRHTRLNRVIVRRVSSGAAS